LFEDFDLNCYNSHGMIAHDAQSREVSVRIRTIQASWLQQHILEHIAMTTLTNTSRQIWTVLLAGGLATVAFDLFGQGLSPAFGSPSTASGCGSSPFTAWRT